MSKYFKNAHKTIEQLIEAEAALTHGTEPICPVVLSTRIRLARNLAEYPFPGWAQRQQRYKVLEACETAIQSLPIMQESQGLDIDDLNDIERQVLVERRMISRELSSSEQASAVIMSKDQSCAIMINEEDHLRIQVVCNGFHFDKIWPIADQVDTALEQKLEYAFSDELGYLTACPTNVGTGLRASVMMHLPALVIANQMEKVIRGMNQIGIAVRGIAGEGSDASGSFFQISNQQTLGESEEAILKRLTKLFQSIIQSELNARAKLLEDDYNRLTDKIFRGFGLLKNSFIMSSSEAMNLLSLMRLAVDFGMLPEKERAGIDRLFIQCQPAHVQFNCLQTGLEPSEETRDMLRAHALSTHFSRISKINFPKTTNNNIN